MSRVAFNTNVWAGINSAVVDGGGDAQTCSSVSAGIITASATRTSRCRVLYFTVVDRRRNRHTLIVKQVEVPDAESASCRRSPTTAVLDLGDDIALPSRRVVEVTSCAETASVDVYINSAVSCWQSSASVVGNEISRRAIAASVSRGVIQTIGNNRCDGNTSIVCRVKVAVAENTKAGGIVNSAVVDHLAGADSRADVVGQVEVVHAFGTSAIGEVAAAIGDHRIGLEANSSRKIERRGTSHADVLVVNAAIGHAGGS